MNDVTLDGPDGATLTFGRVRDENARSLRPVFLGAPEFHDFGLCPICGDSADPTREHVPQGDLGGRAMTMTCKKCNNGLGSRVERELLNWFDDAYDTVRFSSDGVQGLRRAPRVLVRTTPTGEFALIPDKGKTDPEFDKMLASGTIQMHYVEPDSAVWIVAALKHAYLGACLCLGEVPDTALTRQIRSELVAARDSRRGSPFPESATVSTLRISKSYAIAHGPSVGLVALVDDEDVPGDYGISLAGTLFVSWPLEAELFWVAVNRYNQP